MIRQDNLHPATGAVKKRKRIGRGDGSGHGTYSGRGVKGQKSRAGSRMTRGFEGGQLPLIRRLPRKRGFTNIFRTEYQIVKLEQLNVFEPESEITPQTLVDRRVIKSSRKPVKILVGGELRQPLSVKVHKCSATAKTMIEAAGGKVEEIADAAKTD